MTPTTNGFAFEGFLRVLQGDIMSLIGLVALVLVGLIILKSFIMGRGEGSAGDIAEVRKIANRGAGILIVAICVGFVVHAATIAATNRMPRSDVAGQSGVYERMDDLLNRPTR